MQPHRAVHSGDQRHLNVENVHEDFPALTIDLVVALWGTEVEALRDDGLHERVAAARHDDNAIITVRPDRMKQVDKLFVGMPIENQRVAIRVKCHFQHACLLKSKASIPTNIELGDETT